MSRPLVVLALMLALGAAPAAAQDRGSIAVLGGVTQVDLAGVATSPITSFRVSSGLDRTFLVEGAMGYLAYGSQADVTVHHVLPEVQLQLQWRRPGVWPYLGAGVGFSHERWPDESSTDLTSSAAAGARIPIAGGWALQSEIRIRAVDPWTGSTADLGVGVAGRF